MGKHSRSRNRGGDSSDEEILRGKYREALKEIRQLHSYIKQLEKRLKTYEVSEYIEDSNISTPQESVVFCKKCKSDNIEIIKVKKMNKPVNILVCKECSTREVEEEK